MNARFALSSPAAKSRLSLKAAWAVPTAALTATSSADTGSRWLPNERFSRWRTSTDSVPGPLIRGPRPPTPPGDRTAKVHPLGGGSESAVLAWQVAGAADAANSRQPRPPDELLAEPRQGGLWSQLWSRSPPSSTVVGHSRTRVLSGSTGRRTTRKRASETC
jgi:hypothetical protein